MKPFKGLLVPVFLVMCASMAHAALQVTYVIDGGPVVTCGAVVPSNPPAIASTSCSAAGPPIILNLNADSQALPGSSQEDSAVGSIRNSDIVSHTIAIAVSSTGFTSPVTPPDILMLSHIGGSVATGVAGSSLSFQSCVDGGNALLSASTPASAACPGGSITTPVQTPPIDVTGSFNSDASRIITVLASPYAIDEVLNIVLAPNESFNFSASTTLTPVPEPMSIALLGGMFVVMAGAIRRKRNQAARS